MSTYIIIKIKTMYHNAAAFHFSYLILFNKVLQTISMDRYNDRHVFCNNTFFVVSRDKIIV